MQSVGPASQTNDRLCSPPSRTTPWYTIIRNNLKQSVHLMKTRSLHLRLVPKTGGRWALVAPCVLASLAFALSPHNRLRSPFCCCPKRRTPSRRGFCFSISSSPAPFMCVCVCLPFFPEIFMSQASTDGTFSSSSYPAEPHGWA